MSRVSIRELGRVITGNTPSKHNNEFYSSNDIFFIKPDIISDKKITYIKSTNEFISEKARSKARIIKNNAVLVTCIGSIGKICIVKDGEFAFNQQINAIESNEKVSVDYLAYCLLYNKSRLIHIANSPVVPILNKTQFENFQINITDDREEQNRIVEILNLISSVIETEKRQLGQLDELIKARFVEMFGDPIRNTQCRPTTKFINVVKMQRGFDLPVQDRQQDGAVSVYGSNGVLGYHNNAKIKGGGIITGRSGTIGKVFYTEDDYWPLNTSLFSVDTYGNNVIYLAYLLQMYDLTRFVEGTGVPTLNRNMFHNKPIIDVSKEEQNIFAAFVHQTDKSKFLFWIFLLSIKLVADFQYKIYNILIATCEITALCLQSRSLYGRTGFNSI